MATISKKSPNKNIGKKQVEYKSMNDQREHVLHRPDMYIGSILPTKDQFALYEDGRISVREATINPGLMRIFIEVLSNAIDNVWRSSEMDVPMKTIKVAINQDTGLTSIWNDGYHISVTPFDTPSSSSPSPSASPSKKGKKSKKEDESMYKPEKIFGTLLTSSNYNDSEERMTSGRNGLGVKLTNIFSKEFKVTCCDPDEGKQYTQTWSENMSVKDKAKVTKSARKSGYTEVEWTPDFAKFGCEGYSDDMIALMHKHVVESAMITGLNVYLNDEKLPVKSLLDYAKLFTEEGAQTQTFSIEEDKKHIDIVIASSPYKKGVSMSYVNGIETREGGVHEAFARSSIFTPLLEKINPKKGPTITSREISPYFSFFVKYTAPNPAFTSQEKSKLVSPSIKGDVPQKVINAIARWDVISDVKDLLKSKDLTTLKKAEKKRGFKRIEGLDSANNAGGKNSKDCTLILCEGLSAKTYAVRGVEVGAYGKKGRDWFGIYPLRGKLLNVRNASATTISANREITDVISALNLRYGVDYTDDKNFSTLNYGRVMILTDADTDGLHIAGLILNFFHSLFPSLFYRETPFVVCMKTPIIMVYKGVKATTPYYTVEEYKEKKHPQNARVKYFKGLGSWNGEEAKESFAKKMVEFKLTNDTDDAMNKVFSSKQSDERKTWLSTYDPNKVMKFGDKGAMMDMNIEEFIDTEMIRFSIDDCKRSIPSMMDGLKESQRKIMYAVFLKGLKHTGTTMKVAQLAGFVAEKTNYHHGEIGLFETIIKMANDFVGSNNMPYLYRDGQFGSRLSGGKDAANGRYIFTKLEEHTRQLFHEDDDPILTHIMDDGDMVEPHYYVPVIPTILLNGCTAGIGTGWSTSVPNYALKDIIKMVEEWIDTGDVEHDPLPHYTGFTGTIEKTSEGKYATYGTVTTKGDIATVSELPVGMWTDKFKDTIEEWMEERRIKSYKNYSTPNKVHFEIKTMEDGIAPTVEDMKLKTTLSTTNMVLFNKDGVLQKFDTVMDIVKEWCPVRLDYYKKRRTYMLTRLKDELSLESNKMRFIKAVMEGDLVLNEREEEDIESDLEKNMYEKRDDSYRYLLNLPVRSFSKNKLVELQKNIDILTTQIKTMEATTPKSMWKSDLTILKNIK
jgi:DNA topoisomerase-2